jgi:hypothetical protein
VGTLSGIADGDPPHAPRGGLARAAPVGEALRAWQVLRVSIPAARPRRTTLRAVPATGARRRPAADREAVRLDGA